MPQPLDYSPLDRAGAASIFFPRVDSRPAPAGATDLLIDVEPGVAVAARFYVHDPAALTILYFHGNGEVAADHDDIAPLYHEIGLNLFVAEFRGYGRSGGQPSYASLIADAHPVVERFHALLDDDGFAPQRLVMGRSLGSGPALEVAANASDRILGCIIESGAANIRRMLTRLGIAETPESVQLADEHEAKIRSIRLPTLILHGEHDELVPPAYAAELYDLLSEIDRELIIIPGVGHNDILWRGTRQYFDAIRAFTSNLVPDP